MSRCLAHLRQCQRKCLSLGHNDALPDSGIDRESTVLQLPTCGPIHRGAPQEVGILELTVFPTDTTARYAQHRYRDSNLTITIWRSSTYNIPTVAAVQFSERKTKAGNSQVKALSS